MDNNMVSPEINKAIIAEDRYKALVDPYMTDREKSSLLLSVCFENEVSYIMFTILEKRLLNTGISIGV